MTKQFELNNVVFTVTDRKNIKAVSLEDLSEDWCAQVVDEPIKGSPFRPLGSVLTYPAEDSYRDYVAGCWMKNVCTPKESFETFLVSKGFNIKDPEKIKIIYTEYEKTHKPS